MTQIAEIKRALIMGSIEEIDVNVIIAVLLQADEVYFDDEAESPLEDAEYDALKQYAQRTAPANEYFIGVGSAVRGGKVDLPYKMGSLNQTYLGDFVPWVQKEKLQKEMLVISDKLDGTSGLIVYDATGDLQIGYSRGDGTKGADITRHLRQIHNVPQKVNNDGNPLVVRVENIISPANFKRINNGKYTRNGRIYKNPRNMVSGLMNSSENHPEIYKVIDTVAYEVVGSKLGKLAQFQLLEQLGFKTARYTCEIAGKLDDEKLTVMLNAQRATSEYEIDGVVIDVDSASTRNRLDPNRTELNPAYAVKFKVASADNFAEPTVQNVEWNISKDGYFKPRVQFTPVELCGVTIRNASGFNAKFIKDNMIGPGAVIRLTRSGDVIPFIMGVVKPADEPQMPTEDATWTSTGVDLVVADENNATMKFERLNDFFASIDVPHLGEGNLQKMFDLGFTTPESIIPLTQEDFGSLVGSLSIGRKIFLGMKEKLTNIPLYKLMGSHAAFGRGVGVRKMKKLWDAFAGDMSKCADLNAIVAVEGFDTKTANKIVKGVDQFNKFMGEICEYVTISPYIAPAVGGLSGKVFVFTGFRSKELEQAVEAAGGKMGSSVSSKTTYLVTEDPNSTSGKAQKARDLGVAVIGIEELKGMV